MSGHRAGGAGKGNRHCWAVVGPSGVGDGETDAWGFDGGFFFGEFVDDGFDACEPFADAGFAGDFPWETAGDEGVGGDPVEVCEPEGAWEVEVVGDDDAAGDPEFFAGADHGVERAEAEGVGGHGGGGDAEGDEGVAHVAGFVVVGFLVIAAEEEVFDAPGFEEGGGGVDADAEVGVFATADETAGAEDDADVGGGDGGGGVEDAVGGAEGEPEVDAEGDGRDCRDELEGASGEEVHLPLHSGGAGDLLADQLRVACCQTTHENDPESTAVAEAASVAGGGADIFCGGGDTGGAGAAAGGECDH